MKTEGMLTRKQEIRKKIVSFEESMKSIPGAMYGDTDHCPLKHSYADGIYVREIFIPKGTLIVGKIHKYVHPNFLMKGEVSVVTESKGVERLKAPLSMISEAGTKRVVYAHEDTIWITVHKTDETDPDKIEDEIIAKTFDELPESFKDMITQTQEE